MEFIGHSIFPSIDKKIIAKMVEFSNRVSFSLRTETYSCMSPTYVISMHANVKLQSIDN